MNIENIKWDYTELAASYDKRADYAKDTIAILLNKMGLKEGDVVADIGAGTAKLTKELLRFGLTVISVEPNDEMRKFGVENTKEQNVTWVKGAAEDTGLKDNAVKAVFFGSSFNVVNKELALKEAFRLAGANGWFACMWNHRDLTDPVQTKIESIIKSEIPNYDYGDRRSDQKEILQSSGYFKQIEHLTGDSINVISNKDYIEAWRSHGTLQRQANGAFNLIINKIDDLLNSYPKINVPYQTQIWFAQFTK